MTEEKEFATGVRVAPYWLEGEERDLLVGRLAELGIAPQDYRLENRGVFGTAVMMRRSGDSRRLGEDTYEDWWRRFWRVERV